MPIFLLRPINPSSSEWELSAVRCPVQVDADDEYQARHAAFEQFKSGADLSSYAARLGNPWLRKDQVRAEITEYSETLPLIQGQKPNGARGRTSELFLYELTPVNTEAAEWPLSTRCVTLYVKARNHHHARALAAIHYDINVQSELYSPWWHPRLVAVKQLDSAPSGATIIDPMTLPARLRIRMRHKG